MTFLPIVERELRVATRRKSTFRVRFFTALVAIFISVCFLAVASSAWAGRLLFQLLTIATLIICLLAGIFLTADCLSQERREGTLGFLFLTDLKGYDVVLGKFIASSLNIFLSLLALLPVIALSLLLGGVTGGEFWRTALVLVNALFFSLTLGMLTSSRGSDAHRTMGNTLLWIVFFAVLAIGVEVLCRFFGYSQNFYSLSAFSPVQSFLYASEFRFVNSPRHFWLSLLGSHCLAWIFLALASRFVPALLEEKIPVWRQKSESLLRKLSRLSSLERRRREEKLAANPVFWLVTRSALMHRTAWLFAICAIVALFLGVTSGHKGEKLATGYVVFLFLFKITFAIQACRFFVEARRTNALEQLCTTPLSEADILDGQWLALQKVFLVPCVLLLVAPFIAGMMVVRPDPAAKVFGFYVILKLLVDIFALGWVGMWLGLSLRRPIFASALTIIYVLIIPLAGMACGLDFVIDLALAAWARNKLLRNIREQALN